MPLAWISVGALFCAIVLSCTTAINVGVLSLALAWFVGVYLAGMPIAEVFEGFPTPLFITLVGVTMLFSMAQCNGTLERLTARAVRLCRGHAGMVPVMFFGLALLVSTIGPGATPTSALLAPPAMAIALRAGVPLFLMAIMAGNGAMAGTLSPFAPTGIVAHGVMARIGLGGVEWQTYAYNVIAHSIVGFGGFVLLGGWRLFTRGRQEVREAEQPDEPFQPRHWLTLAVIVGLIVGVVGFDMHVGMTALAGAGVLTLARAADEKDGIRAMPWGVILMVTGVTVLIGLMEKTQGMELFTGLIARISTAESVTAIVGFVTGIVSVYSSTSGVVLPAFLPMVPGLANHLGGAVAPLAIAWSMNVGASLVDLSPLSTAGALFLAAAPPGTDTRRLFNALLVWGFSMAVVAAPLCWLMFG